MKKAFPRAFLLKSNQLGDSVRVAETYFFSSMSSLQDYKLVRLHPGTGYVYNEGMGTIITDEIYLLPYVRASSMFGEIRCSCWGDPAIPSTSYRVKRILWFLSISGAIYPVTAIWVALSPRANDPSRLSPPLWEIPIRSVLCVCLVFR